MRVPTINLTKPLVRIDLVDSHTVMRLDIDEAAREFTERQAIKGRDILGIDVRAAGELLRDGDRCVTLRVGWIGLGEDTVRELPYSTVAVELCQGEA